MDVGTLLESYGAGFEELQRSLAGLREEEWKSVPIEGMWSIHEVVCHLADFEVIGADRIKRVLAEDNPTLAGADPDDFHRRLAYNSRNVEDELRLIETTRCHMMSILSHCDIEEFQRTGVHSEDGPMTLEALVERVTLHLPHHIRFINEKRLAMSQ